MFQSCEIVYYYYYYYMYINLFISYSVKNYVILVIICKQNHLLQYYLLHYVINY
jgi:hypothetical protein